MPVWLMIAKGSLRHRIEKLGLEKADAELTEPQRLLREAAQAAAQVQEADEEPDEEHRPPERPRWAKGAFIYLSKGDARVMPKVIAEKDFLLQSKHIIASHSLRRIVKMALAAQPNIEGREGFLLRRAGTIDTEEEWKLPGSNAGPDAQEDGSSSNDLLVEGAGSAASGQDTPSQTDVFGPVKKHKSMRLVQCDPSLMEDDRVKGLDLELLEFLTSPPSVQMLDPGMWMSVWAQVCEENKWIEMRKDLSLIHI